MADKETQTVRTADGRGDRYEDSREPSFTPKVKRLARKPGPRKTARYRFRDFAMI